MPSWRSNQHGSLGCFYGGLPNVGNPTGLGISSSVLPIQADGVTAIFWLYCPIVEAGSYYFFGIYGLDCQCYTAGSPGVFECATFPSTGYDLSAFVANQWQFVALTNTPTTATGYMCLASSLSSFKIATSAQGFDSGQTVPFSIGNTKNFNFGSGYYIAGFKAFGRSLSLAEVVAERQQIAPVNDRNVISYVPMRSNNPWFDEVLGVPWTVYGAPRLLPLRPPVPEVRSPRRAWIFSPSASLPMDPIFYGTNS